MMENRREGLVGDVGNGNKEEEGRTTFIEQ
jgi:hypothetical protein